jgi:hypothetical protein
MTTRLLVPAIFLLWSGLGVAQTVEVTRNVNLRADPSTDNPPIRLLTPPEQVKLLEPDKTADYYHVQTALGEEGWVWSHNVRILEVMSTPTPSPGVTETPTPGPGPLESATATPTPSGAVSAIDEMWDKPNPQGITYTTVHGSCGPAGKSGSDGTTNLRKNRVDTPSAYHEVTYAAIATLSYPSDAKSRATWTPAHLADIARYEGTAITVVGFLSHDVKVEGKESCNCSYASPDSTTEVDWHMYLTSQSSRPISEAVVVETTPRVRKDHLWNQTKLLGWVDSPRQVRISGWLMLDPEHADQVGQYRSTIWEIHPITKIEVWQSGAWIDLETLH